MLPYNIRFRKYVLKLRVSRTRLSAKKILIAEI